MGFRPGAPVAGPAALRRNGHGGPLPLETGYGGSSLIVVTHHCTDALAEKIAEAEPYFSAVTLVLVGEGHGEKLDLPVLRLAVGCDAAEALAALE